MPDARGGELAHRAALAAPIEDRHGKTPREDEVKIRSAAVAQRIPIMTTMRAAKASLQGIRSLREQGFGVKCIQEFHPAPAAR